MEVNFLFNTCIRKTKDLLWPMPPYSIFWWIGVFHLLLLWFWKRGSNGHMSVVLSPIWLKFWPKVRLASLLDCYSMKKLGYLLKKQSFGRFPSLEGNGKSLKAYADGKMWVQVHILVLACWGLIWTFDRCRYLLTCWCEQVPSKTSKKVQQTCVSRFKPDLAQILAKGLPG